MRVAYVVNNAAFFVSHRLPIAKEMLEHGHHIYLFIGRAGSDELEDQAIEILNDSNISFHRAGFKGSGTNPFSESIGFMNMTLAIRKFKPDIMHCVSPKGVLYGALAAKLLKVPGVVLAISGMGHLFTFKSKSNVIDSYFRLMYRYMLSYFIKNSSVRVIVQNRDDQDFIHKLGCSKQRINLIPGSGVNLDLYENADLCGKENIVLFPARLLADKGIFEYITAASSLKKKFPKWRFLIAGAADYDNPSAVTREEIRLICDDTDLEWLGHVSDMPSLYMRANIVCLPSYREGMPKALLEAAAAYCAVVTTNVTGCREAIIDKITGDLVSVKNAIELEICLENLIKDVSRREQYGRNARLEAEKRFSIESVVDETIGIYGAF